MSETKHTPGPWAALFPKTRFYHEGVDVTNFEVLTQKTRAQFRAEGLDHYDRSNEDVANVSIVSTQFWGDMTDEEAKANARLIAAAPELLEALQGILDEDMEDSKRAAFWGGFVLPDDLRQQARAAIAKAKGEEA